MIVILVLVAFCAFAAGQDLDCSQLVSRGRVRSDRAPFMPAASASDPVIFSCTAQTANRSAYAAATAYLAGYLLDYRCMDPDGWEPIAGADRVNEVHERDIPADSCSACVANVPGTSTTPAGHCQRESGLAGPKGHATCTNIGG